MPDNVPKITVLMPVYNAELFLEQAIESILKQTYRDFEFLILDDGSTDRSSRIIGSYKDPRIRIKKNEKNIGYTRTLNRGLRSARGEYIARLDADDASLEGRLEAQAAFLDSRARIAVVGTWAHTMDQQGRRTGLYRGRLEGYSEYLFSLLERSTPLYHPSVMYRRKAVLSVGSYNPALEPAEDFDLWTRLALAGYGAHIIKKPLCEYRIHSGQQSTMNRRIQRRKGIHTQEKLLERFSNGFSPRHLRFFFENDDRLWREIPSFREMTRLVRALSTLAAGMGSELGLSTNQFFALKDRIRIRSGEVALKGASLASRANSLPLYLMALQKKPALSLNQPAMKYPFYCLPGRWKEYLSLLTPRIKTP